MGKRIQNIYEYLCNYTEKEIDDMIQDLSLKEKELIRDRYGDDLHNPVQNDSFTQEKRQKYYANLVPKMKRLLAERKLENLNTKLTRNTELDLKNQLLELIKYKKNNIEICKTLNINKEHLYHLLLDLKNTGMMISRKYYSDGSIQYNPIRVISELKIANSISQDKTIITDTYEDSLKLLVLSDLHFGNQLERKDLMDRAFNYCKKNGINIILCGGDLIDGTFTQGEQKISDLNKQIEYTIKNYPYDKNILTIGVAGDHDISALFKGSLNIIEICNNFRHDIIFGGYNNTGINIKNDQILLYHRIEGGFMRDTKVPIILHGHYHKYTTKLKDNTLNISIPSLSNINQPMPSVLELDLDFIKGYIKNSTIKHIYFADQDIVLSESTFDLLANRTVNYGKIKNTEPYREYGLFEDEEQLVKKLQPLSQIEKFNKRYGKQ